MSFDQSTRNRLQKFVSNARGILGEEFTRQLQATYGLDPKQGTVADIASLTHLDNRQRQTAHLLRETLAHYLATTVSAKTGKGEKGEQERTRQALDRIVREQAFTILNRLAALRMAEARGFLRESVAKGHSSQGFQLYRQLSGTAHGETGDAYRNYLFSLFDEFSLDLAVLFDRHSAQGRLFPRESALLELLAEINHHEIEHLWAEDETIGWIYQYFNSQEERRQMRAESQAPRNSRELAVRNQFFTPRYVVEFLTDNTLGRIWYEMTRGNTALADTCRYLVRRPTEVFLKPDEPAPESAQTEGESLSQEELLQQPVYTPHRPLKDPRSIRMLDPACGSMHFGLYAFDLFERIYQEAWQLETELGPDAFIRETGFEPLQMSFDGLDDFKRQIPKLIIEHNIHGVDIDPRAVQIAGLSLWQRAQRAWHQLGIQPQQRPAIVKSNIVCAEPMPGEKTLLQEFTHKLNPPVLGQLLEVIFDKMQLAGEAGTLLKIEEEIQTAIKEAREQWLKESGSQSMGDMFQTELDSATPQKKLGFDLRGIDDETFWDDAEQRILQALSDYADQAESTADQKRLFAEDAAKGFAFIELCRKRFDVVLMNPPFGACSPKMKPILKSKYPATWTDLYSAFFSRSLELLSFSGYSAAITSNLWLSIKRQEDFRVSVTSDYRLHLVADLGGGVLDTATVDTSLAVIENRKSVDSHQIGFYIARDASINRDKILSSREPSFVPSTTFSQIPSTPLCFDLGAERISLWMKHSSRLDPDIALTFKGNGTFDNFRFLRNFWEVKPSDIGYDWIRYDKGGFFQPFFNPTTLVWRYKGEARENRAFQIGIAGTDAQVAQSNKHWLKPGICYSRATSIGFSPRLLASDHVVNDKSIAIIPRITSDTMGILALLNSTHIQDLLYAFGYHRNIEKGAVASLPLHQELITKNLANSGREAVEAMINLESTIETSPIFSHPQVDQERSIHINKVVNIIENIDREVDSYLYSRTVSTQKLLCRPHGSQHEAYSIIFASLGI
ncbi:BREX-1 system adenine-specific DNA-methyltransferase PglX, partial [Kistimonas scapharcae]|uniref:BREX-1 system adenine-specific DNA-methyltransferase PglX n=1 Tax=Kistimonas scapharcae TaxID=1036133 RepID=UPI0031EB0B86